MFTKVVALHGMPGSADMLREDMCNPYWVDKYHQWKGLAPALNQFAALPRLILVGFSQGGARAVQLANILTNVAGIVLYESPLPNLPMSLDPTRSISADCPVLTIWNNNGRKNWKRCVALSRALEVRRSDAPVDILEGEGRHIRMKWSFPPFRHCWDARLNSQIGVYIQKWIEAAPVV